MADSIDDIFETYKGIKGGNTLTVCVSVSKLTVHAVLLYSFLSVEVHAVVVTAAVAVVVVCCM